MSKGGATHTQTRVLIFDTDPKWCTKISDLLRKGGFYCETEIGSFSECSAKSAENPFHYAIINYNSLNKPKQQLLAFGSEFPTTETILLGDHDSADMFEYSWEPKPIARHVYGGKDNRPLTDLRKLVSQLDQLRRRVGDVRVNFSPSVDGLLDEYAKSRSVGRSLGLVNREQVSLSGMKQELEVVIESLFASRNKDIPPIAKEVDVEPFSESGKSSSCLLKLTPKILLGGIAKSAVLKFGPKEDIAKESMNYDRFVEWFLTVEQTVKKIGYSEAHRFAGLVYSYPKDVPGGTEPFAKFIRNHSLKDSLAIITAMFNTGNRHWLAVEGNNYVDSDYAVFQEYYIERVLHASISEMRQVHLPKLAKEVRAIERAHKIELIDVEDDIIKFPAFNLNVPNAITRLGADPIVDELKLTVVHGDLHAHNILIDKEGKPYFIDFFYTGFGDIYRDFIELEISVRYDLFSSKEIPLEERFTSPDGNSSNVSGMRVLATFEKELLKSSLHEQETKNKTILENESLNKAFRIILEIRRFARENCHEKWHLYFAGLAVSCLKGIKYFYPPDVKMHRLFTAGLYWSAFEKKSLSDKAN